MIQPVFLLPGQGSQASGMARGLYETEEVYRHALEEFLTEHARGGDLRAAAPGQGATDVLADSAMAQSLIVAHGCSLARLLISEGINPQALVGYSAGELTAAGIAGIFGTADLAKLMCAREPVLARCPRGGMLAVAMDVGSVHDLLGVGPLVVAAVNAPRQLVLSGPERAVNEAEQTMARAGVTCSRVESSTAFHHPMLEPYCPEMAAVFQPFPMAAPGIPVLSCTTGDWLSVDASSPDRWGWLMARPLNFWATLDRLSGMGKLCFIDFTPGGPFGQIVRRHARTIAGEWLVAPNVPTDGAAANWFRSVLHPYLDTMTR